MILSPSSSPWPTLADDPVTGGDDSVTDPGPFRVTIRGDRTPSKPGAVLPAWTPGGQPRDDSGRSPGPSGRLAREVAAIPAQRQTRGIRHCPRRRSARTDHARPGHLGRTPNAPGRIRSPRRGASDSICGGGSGGRFRSRGLSSGRERRHERPKSRRRRARRRGTAGRVGGDGRRGRAAGPGRDRRAAGHRRGDRAEHRRRLLPLAGDAPGLGHGRQLCLRRRVRPPDDAGPDAGVLGQGRDPRQHRVRPGRYPLRGRDPLGAVPLSQRRPREVPRGPGRHRPGDRELPGRAAARRAGAGARPPGRPRRAAAAGRATPAVDLPDLRHPRGRRARAAAGREAAPGERAPVPRAVRGGAERLRGHRRRSAAVERQSSGHPAHRRRGGRAGRSSRARAVRRDPGRPAPRRGRAAGRLRRRGDLGPGAGDASARRPGVWVSAWIRPLRGPDGRIAAVHSIWVDITDRVLADAERARLQQQNLYLQEELKSVHNFEEIVGRSPRCWACSTRSGGWRRPTPPCSSRARRVRARS